jgi:tetratricopeptide (TPR) repeat protein
MDFTGKEDAGTWVRIANAYIELGQYDKVIAPSDKAIALYAKEGKPNQNPFILKINSYYERKMFTDAVKVLETVVQIFPENKTWWTQLGSFYTLVEDYKNALYIFDMSYKQGFLTKDTEIKTLASLYASNEVPYKAAKLLEKHIDSGLVARDDKSLAQLANAWHASQEILKAAKVYGELAKLTNDARHYRKQGALLLQAEKYSQSVEPLTKALELDNKDKGKIYISLMEAYFYQGKYKDAMAMNKEALEDNSSARTARAWTQYIVDTAQRKNVKI